MPEGPEVRKYADALQAALSGRTIVSFAARTKEARKWLQENGQRLTGRRVERVVSHGKHLIGYIEDGFFFHSHLMMWGRWQTIGPTGGPTRKRGNATPSELPEKERRERARIVVEGAAAILLSAPIFNVGEGDPYEVIEILATLGPDVLPYRGSFDRAEFLRRLLVTEYKDETIGAALLNQRVVAGIGNYLRAEILFHCKLNPWLTISQLGERQLTCLAKTIPRLARDRTSAALRQGKKIGKGWQTIRRSFIKSAVSMAPGIWSSGAQICRVYAAGRRFNNSGKRRRRPLRTPRSARASFTFVRSAREFRLRNKPGVYRFRGFSPN